MDIDITIETPKGKILFHETVKEEEADEKLKQFENRVFVSASMVFTKGKTAKDLVKMEFLEAITGLTIIVK